MRVKHLAVAIAFVGTFGLLTAPAVAQSANSRVYSNRDRTVVISRDEDGRTRTRIIIQKRSYLDPGTEVMPGSEHNHDYAVIPSQGPLSVLDNTAFGSNQTALPGPFDLPSKHNPWIKY
jgi:hypothetical protein